MIALYLWKNTGYSVILLLSGLITIPEDHYAAASLDGATAWQQLRYITMPQMWYSVFLPRCSLINAFKCFREIFHRRTHPDQSIYMLQHFINNAFDKLNYPKLAVASVLLLLVLTVLFALSYRWSGGRRHTRMRKRPAYFSSFAAVLLTALSVIPFLYVFAKSLLSAQNGFTLSYYYQVFLAQEQYLLRFWKSLGLCLCITAGQVVVSTLAGYGFAKCRFREERPVLPADGADDYAPCR